MPIGSDQAARVWFRAMCATEPRSDPEANPGPDCNINPHRRRAELFSAASISAAEAGRDLPVEG